MSPVTGPSAQAIEAQIVRSADAEQAKSTGGMIALLPRQQDAEMIAVPGGEPVEDLHMTVVYFGEDVTGIDSSEILDACYSITDQFTEIDAKVFARAVFNPTGDDPCAVYLIGDNPDISDMYRQLRDVAESVPGAAEQHDPYFPHITIAYNPMAELSYQGPIVFDRLLLAWAGDKKIIPL